VKDPQDSLSSHGGFWDLKEPKELKGSLPGLNLFRTGSIQDREDPFRTRKDHLDLFRTERDP